MARIVVVDDDLGILQVLTEMLHQDGHHVEPFSELQPALLAISSNRPDLILTDLYLEKGEPVGMELVRKARELEPPPVVIVITGYGSVSTAVEAIRHGAFDYVEKPFKLDALRLAIERGLRHEQSLTQTVQLRRELKRKYQFAEIIGKSASMQKVFKLIERVCDTDSTVLILGESGTGKELVARALHYNSSRSHAPFIPINCSALPENLLESELFGHCRGAFTGAIADKQGLFEAAENGTIFLDEVGSMSAMLQSRLLRVLQEREVRRVGENRSIPVNVRVIAATNERLDQKLAENTFRADLYYRLNVIPIQIPSLRERRDDIALLATHFLKNTPARSNGATFRVTRQAMRLLQAYHWPGNVRELQNTIERAVTLCETDTIDVADLPEQMQSAVANQDPPVPDGLDLVPDENPNDFFRFSNAPGATGTATAGNCAATKVLVTLKEHLRLQEITHIQAALKATGGSKEAAAELLGVSLATLYRKLGETRKEL